MHINTKIYFLLVINTFYEGNMICDKTSSPVVLGGTYQSFLCVLLLFDREASKTCKDTIKRKIYALFFEVIKDRLSNRLCLKTLYNFAGLMERLMETKSFKTACVVYYFVFFYKSSPSSGDRV